MSLNTLYSTTSNKISTFTWKISEFTQYASSFSMKSSHAFKASSNEFYLRCCSKIAVEELKSYFAIFLKRNVPFKNDVQVQCLLAILNRSEEKCFVKDFSVAFSVSDKIVDKYLPYDGAVYILNLAHILDRTNRLLQKDTLTIYCEVEVLDNKINNVKSKELSLRGGEKITVDLSTLLESSKFSDVLFVIGNKEGEKKEFWLHKAILATRSEVFNAMLTSDCEEKRKNRVEITDVSVPVFEEMTRYIYTGKTSEGLELYAQELFVAADKYQLDLLKSQAAHELASKLCIESACGVLLLADMHSDAQLKVDCIKYITQHSKQVMQTEAWKVVIEPRADLMAQLYRDLSNSK